MKILILSSLFPPDPGKTGQYVKELTKNLSYLSPTLLIYGFLPEKVAGAEIIAIDKRQGKFSRLINYAVKLFMLAKKHDLILVNNAPAIELPVLIIFLFRRMNIVLINSDPDAINRNQTGWYSWLNTRVTKIARKVVTLPSDDSYLPPEWLPANNLDTEKQQVFKDFWHNHTNSLTRL